MKKKWDIRAIILTAVFVYGAVTVGILAETPDIKTICYVYSGVTALLLPSIFLGHYYF